MAKNWLSALLSAAAFAMVFMFAPAADAAAVGVPGAGAFSVGESLVVKTHGWHGACAWGRAGPHRHIRGYGRVPCGRPNFGNRCRIWRHECADRWGWGGWRFRRCLRNHGC
ncbi:MAG: hypothetical protein NW217_13455 [Hyphomicrobiaceae bacterium]|nr:hypothetical protein [Hyphomicrobiaceae bacterium]